MTAIIYHTSKIGKACLVNNQSFAKIQMCRPFGSSLYLQAKPQKMQQVEVDESDVKQKLGDIQMAFVKKAESTNKERASRHIFFRRKDWRIAGACFTIAISIYFYTIYAMKQENFLDDFEMPDPLLEEESEE